MNQLLVATAFGSFLAFCMSSMGLTELQILTVIGFSVGIVGGLVAMTEQDSQNEYRLIESYETEGNREVNIFSNNKNRVVLVDVLEDFLEKNNYIVRDLSEYIVEKIAEYRISKYAETVGTIPSKFMSCVLDTGHTVVDLTENLKELEGPRKDFLYNLNHELTAEAFIDYVDLDYHLDTHTLKIIDNNCDELVWEKNQPISEVLGLKKE